MARITSLDPAAATGKTKNLFDAVQLQMGKVPNMVRTMGHSPALLGGYLTLSRSLNSGTLSAPLREELALAVAQTNGCDYCLAAHVYSAQHVLQLDARTIAASRSQGAIDPETDAALTFARQLVQQHGHVSAAEVAAVRAAGYSEAEVGEIVGLVALNILTNYFNLMADVALDFPAAPPLELKAATEVKLF
jgi:uncharacterized peroxidase-related enzyme